MKHYFATLVLGLSLCEAAWGGLTPYENSGDVTSPPVVDGLSFFNSGNFNIGTFSFAALTNVSVVANGLFGGGYTVFPFETKDTLYFTNTGLMSCQPGFEFETVTSSSHHSASLVLNQGLMEGVDTVGFPNVFSVVGSTTFVTAPNVSQAIPSQLLVYATNIINTGVMSVGDVGVLRLTGNNVTNSHASLSAGTVATVGENEVLTVANEIEDLDTATGLQGQEEWEYAGGTFYYVNAPYTYDLFWGVTNTQTLALDQFEAPYTDTAPLLNVNGRGFNGAGGEVFGDIPLPINADTANFFVYVDYYPVFGTNLYFNIVFVNQNLIDPTMTATVGFTGAGFPEVNTYNAPNDPNGEEAIVQFAKPVYDVVTGTTVMNGVYLIDDGAYLGTMSDAENAGAAVGFSKPNAFEVTTTTPLEWVDTFPGNFDYSPELVYTNGTYKNKDVPFVDAEYGVQIGRNPSDISGSFVPLLSGVSDASFYLSELQVNLPDPTNEGGRIEINAGNLDVTGARMRAEGMVVLNVTNLVGGGSQAVDWGELNAALGSTNGSLVVSGFFPTNFARVRGDIYAWSANWQNLLTNNDGTFPLNNTGSVTNNIFVHMLVVDQNLFGSFNPAVRNLTLTGQKSIVLQDDLNVISQGTFKTTNLTVISNVSFTQSAENFLPSTTPYLQNLLIAPTGSLSADSTLDVGYNSTQGPLPPNGRTYTVNSITNFGQMTSTAPLLKASVIENDGVITSDNGGSIVLEAKSLGLGLALNANTNFLYADGNVDLSATSIEATNSVIQAGLAPGGLGGSLTLEATEQLTDLVSATPTTNTNSVIVNHWTVTDGFTMPVKPATGDLFGTEIHSIVRGYGQLVTHVWAGTDMGATPAGFANNEVIGRLVLDRQTNNTYMRFSAAGAKNAMYVDYLELTNVAFSAYRQGLIIDPNFTIYFANCNADPAKLTAAYPGMKWVSGFAGPNSTTVVPYTNSSLVCLLNAGVANSTEISFWPPIANFYLLQQTPYILNNPNNWTDILPCPGSNYVFPCDCTPGSNAHELLWTNINSSSNLVMNVLDISYSGQGSISHIPLQSQLALGNSYQLTATPAKGWVFEGWTTAMMGNLITTYSNTLTFAFVTNTVITASFIPNPYPTFAGVYSGLFFETNVVDPGSSGSISLTLTPTGSFSGKLLMGATTYKFSSQFTSIGSAQFAAKSGAESLTVNLQLDLTNQTGLITGDVTNSVEGWDASLAADLAPVWTAKNPSPLAGTYTMALSWNDGTVPTPGGDSYGTITISKLGVLTVAGKLADGSAFSATSPLSLGGQWPFYTYVAAGKDTVLGWVTVTNGLNGANLSGTNLTWSKAAGKGPLYAGGFTNVLPLFASPWKVPAKNNPPLSLAVPGLVLSGGDLPETVTNALTLKTYLTYAGSNTSLTINAATGGFTGSFELPGSKKTQTISGVVLRNSGGALGYFLGTNESGTVLLESQ